MEIPDNTRKDRLSASRIVRKISGSGQETSGSGQETSGSGQETSGSVRENWQLSARKWHMTFVIVDKVA
jgi:hypothetical protein